MLVLPVPLLTDYRFDLPDESATDALAARFAHAYGQHIAPAGLQVHLHGDLGAGKTAFVRATLRALGHTGRVRSPTYTLVEPYQVASLAVHHFDLYRFADPAEWREAGFDEYLGTPALNLIEWPERADGVLSAPDLSFTIDVAGDGRVLNAHAFSEAGRRCLGALATSQEDA